jgi:hypothetical protein
VLPVVLVAPKRFAEEVEGSCSFMLGDLAVIDCIPRQASPLYTGRAGQGRSGYSLHIYGLLKSGFRTVRDGPGHGHISMRRTPIACCPHLSGLVLS